MTLQSSVIPLPPLFFLGKLITAADDNNALEQIYDTTDEQVDDINDAYPLRQIAEVKFKNDPN